jgi:hypothetical protein
MPFVLIATVSDVTSRCKEFASLGINEIQLALNDASIQINTSEFGGPTDGLGLNVTTRLAQAYLAGHFLSARNPNLALPAGPTETATVGEVTAEYAVATAPASEADFNTSRWGRAFLTLCRQNFDSRMIST